MSVIESLIVGRTASDVEALYNLMAQGINPLESHRGAYNASDLNRVGEAVDYIRLKLEEIGYPDNGIVVDFQLPVGGVNIEPYQAGRGDPAPDNIQPITPGLTLSGVGDIYGGALDTATGTLSVDKLGKVFDGTETWTTVGSGSTRLFRFADARSPVASGGQRGASHYKNASITTSSSTVGYYAYTSGSRSDTYVQFRPNLSQIADGTAWKNWLANQYAAGTPLTCWWEVQNPEVYNLTGAQLTEAAKQVGERIVTLNPDTMAKTDWTNTDIPTRSQLEKYLSSVWALWLSILEYRPELELPTEMTYLDYIGANQIENLLKEIDILKRRIELSYRGYSGRLTAGVNGLP